MKMRRKLFAIGLAVASLVCLSACRQSENEKMDDTSKMTDQALEGEDKITIGATLASEDSSYLSSVSEYMKEAAEKAGAELILQYASWDVQIQTQQLDAMIDQKVDVIILCPVNAKSLLTPLKRVEKSGIPLINLNMRLDAVSAIYAASYVGASNSEEAVLAADLIKRMLGEEGGKIAIIEGAPGSDAQIYRTQTFVEQLASSPKIEIVGLGDGEWSREKARLVAYDLIQKNPGLNAIYCHDSSMAMGAIEMVEEMGMEDQVQIIGISELPEYIQAVRDGRLYGFISQPPQYEGMTCIEKAVDLANGKSLQPWYKDPIQIVVKENVDSYAAGFAESSNSLETLEN